MVNHAQALVPFISDTTSKVPEEASVSVITDRLDSVQAKLTRAAVGVTKIRENSRKLLLLTRQCTETWYKV